MFNRLQLQSAALCMFRCKSCLEIVMCQDSIREFICYEPESDLGCLERFSQYPRLEQPVSYFLLQQEMGYCSSMMIKSEEYLVTGYHPFWKMHMFQVTCAQCGYPLGFSVQTVNENTVWMEGRILINIANCAMLRDGRDDMGKIIRSLRAKLGKKMEMQMQVQEKEQKGKSRRGIHAGIVEGLQNYYTPMIRQLKGNRKQSRRSKPVEKRSLKQQMQSMQRTRAMSNQLSREDSSFLMKSNSLSDVHQQSEELLVVEKGKEEEKTLQGEGKQSEGRYKEEDDGQQTEEEMANVDIVQLQLTEHQRQSMRTNMLRIKQQLLSVAEGLESRQLIQRVLVALEKLSSVERYLYRKMPQQLFMVNSLMTYFLTHVLKL